MIARARSDTGVHRAEVVVLVGRYEVTSICYGDNRASKTAIHHAMQAKADEAGELPAKELSEVYREIVKPPSEDVAGQGETSYD